jgi:hypothetical protein
MVWYVIVMMRPSSINGSLEGVGPENSRLFWALKWLKANQKSPDFQGPPLPMPLVMDLAQLKTLKYKLHIKKILSALFQPTSAQSSTESSNARRFILNPIYASTLAFC